MAYTPAASKVLVWANAAAQNGFVREKGDVRTALITGVMSMWQTDYQGYDLDTHNDNPLSDPLSGPIHLSAGAITKYVVLSDENTAAPVTVETVPADEESTNDEILHIPPRPTLKKRTLIELWSNAAGNGSVLYSNWADVFKGWEVSEEANSDGDYAFIN